MLKSIDVVIGLTVILLALSMAVTVITQALTTFVNSRGRHLRRGLADLLQQLDPDLTEQIGKDVATVILTHPLVSASSVAFTGTTRLGNVINREEFTKLLIGLATDNPPLAAEGKAAVTAEAKWILKTALNRNGITEPDVALKKIRTLSMELERSAPQLSNMARQNAAILRAAESDLVAKINSWFDQTMDRTSQRFTASTRAITFAGAFIVAFGLQVDTPSLVNRLAADDTLRGAFVQQGQKMHADLAPQAKGASSTEPTEDKTTSPQSRAVAPSLLGADAVKAQNTTETPQPSSGKTDAQKEAERKAEEDRAAQEERKAQAREQEYRTFLAENGIIKLPSKDGWTEGFNSMRSLLGMLVTALLLSLGAPFWYNALGHLLQLRSALARKEDTERTGRQSNVPAAASGGVTEAAGPAPHA